MMSAGSVPEQITIEKAIDRAVAWHKGDREVCGTAVSTQ